MSALRTYLDGIAFSEETFLTTVHIQHIAVAAFLILNFPIGGNALTAEEYVEFLLNDDRSKYAAPVTIIDSHPLCNNLGAVAFAVDLKAEDVDFTATGDNWDGRVFQYNRDAETTCVVGRKTRSPGVLDRESLCDASENDQPRSQDVLPDGEDPTCYYVVRRGTETYRQERSCPPLEDTAALNYMISEADIQIDITASALICRSLTGHGILESEWTVEFQANGNTETFNSSLGTSPVGYPDGIGAPTVSLSLDSGRNLLETITPDFSARPFQFDPTRSNSIKLSIIFNAAPIAGAEAVPVDIHASRGFRIEVN
jgi:hypothetical protein